MPPAVPAYETGIGREQRVSPRERDVEPGAQVAFTDSVVPKLIPAMLDRPDGQPAEAVAHPPLKLEFTAQPSEPGSRTEKPSPSAATVPVTADSRPPAEPLAVFRPAQRTNRPDFTQFDAARPQQARPEARDENRIHIGAVDIHITQPTPPIPAAPVARRSPTPAAPAISRGFVSPFGFRQG